MTEKYRKPDQHYIDEYDRATIRMLKKLETEATAPLIIPADSFVTKDHYNPMTEFYETAVWRAQSKGESIRKQMAEDEHQDWLVKTTPIPHNIKCNTCRSTMNVVTHFFKENNNQMLFVFECPNEHNVYYGDNGPVKTEYTGPPQTESLGHFPVQFYGNDLILGTQFLFLS